jgi:L-lactate dehydrogenase
MQKSETGEGPRWRASDLREFAFDLLGKSGMPGDRATVVADILVEGDLMGHTTHGLQLLGPYLKNIEAGTMTLDGEPEILSDNGPVRTIDGRYLPGPWLVVRELEELCERAPRYGTATGVIRRSHHIAALAAYLKPVTDRGLMVLLNCSGPETFTVAPHGGLTPWCSPNPLAAGIPTEGDPILIDISMSTTTNGLSMRLNKRGERFGGPWVKDATGEATDDPSVLFGEPAGTVMPLGGLDMGHKGFAMALIVEALTAGWPATAAQTGSTVGAPPSSCKSLTRGPSAVPRPLPAKCPGARIIAASRRYGQATRRCACRGRAPWPAVRLPWPTGWNSIPAS